MWINWDKRKEGILFEVDRREKLEIRGTTRVEEIKKKFAGLIASNKYVLLFRLHVYAFVEKHGCCRPFSSRKLSSFPYIASLLVCCSLKGTPWILIDVTEIESPFFFRRYCRIATYVPHEGLKFATESNFSYINLYFSSECLIRIFLY